MLDIETFRSTGVVTVRQAFSPDAAGAMRDAIWRRVEAHTTARRNVPSSWTTVRLPSFKPLKQRSVFRAVAHSATLAAWLDAIFGPRGWQPSGSGVQILFTFPNTPVWTLPHHFWHMDCGFEAAFPTTMVKVFACLDTVAAGGGGTLALAGSHRLVDRYSAGLPHDQRAGNTASMRRFLNTDVWTRELIRPGAEPDRSRRLMADRHDATGIEVEIVEMTGEPGDVYITDIHTLHCVAPNAHDRPRTMLGAVFHRTCDTGDA